MHYAVKIKKVGIPTFRMVHLIASKLNIRKKFIGVAGMKDTDAVSIQTISVPATVDEEKIKKLNEIEGIEVLGVYRIRRKIRPGMLFGNNFEVFVRECVCDEEKLKRIRAEITAKGCPNFFGYQRFGTVRPNTHLLGKYLVKRQYSDFIRELVYKVYEKESEEAKVARKLAENGSYSEALETMPRSLWLERKVVKMLKEGLKEKQIVERLDRQMLRFFVNAYQSYLFNLMVSKRMEKGYPLLTRISGDFVKGGLPAFPLLGVKSKLPKDESGELVKEVIEKEDVELRDFKLEVGNIKVLGNIRKIPLVFDSLQYEVINSSIKLKFWLEKGSYATMLLREFCKNSMGLF